MQDDLQKPELLETAKVFPEVDAAFKQVEQETGSSPENNPALKKLKENIAAVPLTPETKHIQPVQIDTESRLAGRDMVLKVRSDATREQIAKALNVVLGPLQEPLEVDGHNEDKVPASQLPAKDGPTA
ncbi:hypothetical protein KKC94_04700 [Patescibacteria group bacterium]|nr:hypothetical protein [Patescibacteria group bacterium]